MVGRHRAAAGRAKDAGFEGVELHAANGYLAHQFLSSNANRRSDDYGGSVQRRIRFAIELVLRPEDLFTIRDTGGGT